MDSKAATVNIDAELEKLQRETFGYFLHETNPANGLVIDKTAPNWPASIAATGLALGVSPYHFGLNQGPIILMIENFRSGFVWELMKHSEFIVTGLRRAGFTGGWL